MQYNMSNDVMPWPAQRRVGGPQDSGGDYGPNSGYIGQNINPLQQLLTRLGGYNQMGQGGGNPNIQALLQHLIGSGGSGGNIGGASPADLIGRFAGDQGVAQPPDLVERYANAHPATQVDPGFHKQGGSPPPDLVARMLNSGRTSSRPAAVMGSHLLANQLAGFIQRMRNPALPASASSWLQRQS